MNIEYGFNYKDINYKENKDCAKNNTCQNEATYPGQWTIKK